MATHFYEQILSRNQLQVLGNLGFLGKGVYMAGGTALALQLGHRTSLDFDFYSQQKFTAKSFLTKFDSKFKGQVATTMVEEDTLILKVQGVHLSLFYYPYKLVDNLVPFRGVNLASIADIAAMKMVAISMRGKRRDFVDTYYLLQKFSLEEIIDLTVKKYPSYQPMVILKGLIYFKDAEEEDILRGIRIFDKKFSWEAAKKKILAEVKQYQLSLLKN